MRSSICRTEQFGVEDRNASGVIAPIYAGKHPQKVVVPAVELPRILDSSTESTGMMAPDRSSGRQLL